MSLACFVKTRKLSATSLIFIFTAKRRVKEAQSDRSQSMLCHAGLPQIFCDAVINIAAYLVYMSPYNATSYKTLFKRWHKQNADYFYLRIFVVMLMNVFLINQKLSSIPWLPNVFFLIIIVISKDTGFGTL